MWKYFFLILLLLASCTPAIQTAPASDLSLTSTAFADGEAIPVLYTYSKGSQCSGENVSPPLSWSGAPSGTRSFGLTVIDPDGGNWVHWVLFNIPSGTDLLPEAAGDPETGIAGTNSFGQLGWGGPCPPSGTHHYVFSLYALDIALNLPAGASLKDLQAAMDGHILAQAALTGLHSAP